MKEYATLVTEIFDSPFKWKWTTIDDRLWIAEFSTGKHEYTLESMKTFRKDREVWDINFKIAVGPGIDYTSGNTGTGDAVRVFSTIVSIIKDFLEKIEPEIVEVVGNKALKKGKLYASILKKKSGELKRLGYSIKDRSAFGSLVFTLFKKKKRK